MCMPWMGGVCASPYTPPTPTPHPVSGGGSYRDRRDHYYEAPVWDEGEEILELMSMITPYL